MKFYLIEVPHRFPAEIFEFDDKAKRDSFYDQCFFGSHLYSCKKCDGKHELAEFVQGLKATDQQCFRLQSEAAFYLEEVGS